MNVLLKVIFILFFWAGIRGKYGSGDGWCSWLQTVACGIRDKTRGSIGEETHVYSGSGIHLVNSRLNCHDDDCSISAEEKQIIASVG